MPDTASLCEICGKEKNTGRDGSLTQFVFRFDTCRCELPSLAKFQKKLEQPSNCNENASRSNGSADASGKGTGNRNGTTHAPYNGFESTSAVLEAEGHSTQSTTNVSAQTRSPNASAPHDAPAQTAPPEPELQLPPGSFPTERYAPVRELGRGAAGTVYLCKDRLLGDKYVAVKVLNTVDAEKLLAFHHEAKATSRLNHPNIILILDFGATTNGAPFMVIEYCQGSTLDQFYTYSQDEKARVARDKKAQLEREKHAAAYAWSDKKLESSGSAMLDSKGSLLDIKPAGSLTPSEAVEVFSGICRALTYAHSQGVYHRDIKPSNILLQRDEGNKLRVRLIDFGIASMKEATHEHTIFQGKTIAGTPSYMSPDVAFGRSYDARSEIYSLGCVMFEALSGRRPFEGETSLETLQMHAHAKAPVLSEICPGEEFRALSKIVQQCMEKKKELRFQCAEELRHAIEGVIKHDTNTWKERDTLSARKPHQQRASATTLYAVSIGLVTLLAGSLFMFIAEPDFIASRLERRPDKAKTGSTRSSAVVLRGLPTKKAHSGKREDSRAAASSPPTVPLLFDKTGDPFPDLESGPVYLQEQPGQDFKNYIVQGHVTGDGLKILVGKRYIKRLDLRFDDLPGDACKYLEELPLERINLLGSELDEQSFVHIGRIKTLVQLGFESCTGVTDDALSHLDSLPNLLFLRVGDTAITDRSVDTFLKLGTLKELRMSGCMGITSSGLLRLSEMKNLETLTFRKCNVDERLLKNLHKFKTLNYLGLSELDDDSVKYLTNLKISTLSIGNGHRLTDRGLIELAKLKNLSAMLLVPNKTVTSYGINTFKSRNPKCYFELGDDEGPVRMLYELKQRPVP